MDDTVEVAEVRTDTHTQLGKQPCCNAWRAGITYVVVSLYNYILEGWTPVNSISGVSMLEPTVLGRMGRETVPFALVSRLRKGVFSREVPSFIGCP